MATTTNKIVVYDATAKKHTPLATGDQLPGSAIQLSATPTNSIVLGGDGGLQFAATAALPDDQVLSGDSSGTAAVTLTPSANVADPTQTDYLIKVNVNLAGAQPAGANKLTAVGNALYVAPDVAGTGLAPAEIDDGSTTTRYYGGNTVALGDPTGWRKLADGTVIPVYAEGTVGGTPPPAVVTKRVEYGETPYFATPTSADRIQVIVFTTPFPTVPFITLTRRKQSTYVGLSDTSIPPSIEGLTVNGFTILSNFAQDYNYDPVAGTIEPVMWKAEEK